MEVLISEDEEMKSVEDEDDWVDLEDEGVFAVLMRSCDWKVAAVGARGGSVRS